MSQTRTNKVQVPVNSDPWNLVPDLATMADSSNVAIRVASQSERDGLTGLTAGAIVVRNDLPGSPLETWDGTNWNGPGAVNPTNITYNSGYVNRASGFRTASVYRVGGRCYLQGAVSNGVTISTITAAVSYTIGYVPSGFIPSASMRQFALIQTSASTFSSGYVQVDNVGNIQMFLYTGQSNIAVGNLTVVLDGISWLDQ